MAGNNDAPVGFTNEGYSPSNAVSNPNENTLLTNNNQNLPNYSAGSTPSAPDISDLPPNYFDISIVPNNAVLHYNEVVPYTEASRAEVERKKDGIVSFDSLIDKDADQLWLYFMTYLNEKPYLGIKVHGYHVEHYTTYRTVYHNDGTSSTIPVDNTRNVTDFDFSFDLAPFVSDQWWRVAVLPSEKTIKSGENVSLRDAIEQYTRSEKKIKEIICQKQLFGWDWRELRDKIRTLVYSTGYRSTVVVTFPMENTRITARSSSELSHFAHSTFIRVLCVISCLFIIFGPIYLCLRAAGSTKDKIVAEYSMATPIDTFIYLNGAIITNAVIGRSREVYLACAV